MANYRPLVIIAGVEQQFPLNGSALDLGPDTNPILVGRGAGSGATLGTNTVAVGFDAFNGATAGTGNVVVGHDAGRSLSSGSADNNTFIGNSAGNNGSQLSSATNSIAIGFGAHTTASNQAVLGPSSITATIIRGSVTGYSSFDSAFVFNESGADIDARFEGDSLTHLFFLDATATTENAAFFATAAPNWQSMDRGFFWGNVETVPTGNPTDGVFVYVEAGVPKIRMPNGTIIDLSTGGGGTDPPDIQIFLSGGVNWSKPTGAVTVEAHCIGSGGGGGSGRRGANAATIATGGGGGGGGEYAYGTFAASSLGSTVAITVGGFKAGGANQATNSTNGNAGTAGSASSFGTHVVANGGGAGAGGTTTTAAGGAGGTGGTGSILAAGSAGGAGATGSANAVSGGNVAAPQMAGAGGGGGAGRNAAGTLGFSAAGGNSGGFGGVRGIEAPGETLGFQAMPGGNAEAGLCVLGGTSLSAWGGGGGGGGAGIANTINLATRFGFGGAGRKFGGGGGGGSFQFDTSFDFTAGGGGDQGVVVVITYF